jgi:hypothetical protein
VNRRVLWPLPLGIGTMVSQMGTGGEIDGRRDFLRGNLGAPLNLDGGKMPRDMPRRARGYEGSKRIEAFN